MLINVATLIQEPIGHARRYDADGEAVAVPEQDFEQVVTGPIRLIRSERGVLVSASFDLEPVGLQCDRCLQLFEAPLHIEFDEEYVVVRDATTGRRTEIDSDDFVIDGTWHLDLSEAVRQYEESALPIRALCRPDCRGLCATCGQNLNEHECGCDQLATQPQWDALAVLAEQLRSGQDEEEQDGAPEA
ncbi:MAG: DUF177 domain-containing protein [Chloroflexi bacterium]|nr:DUF177 domain-containing protein [Chloroflexota bacterium]MQC48142.1 DUF177 domain-containing protein [Chloroflexota bacterium]